MSALTVATRLIEYVEGLMEIGTQSTIGEKCEGCNLGGVCHCDVCKRHVIAVYKGAGFEVLEPDEWMCKECADAMEIIIPLNLVNTSLGIDPGRNEIYERLVAERKRKSLEALKGLLERRGKKVTGKLAAL